MFMASKTSASQVQNLHGVIGKRAVIESTSDWTNFLPTRNGLTISKILGFIILPSLPLTTAF